MGVHGAPTAFEPIDRYSRPKGHVGHGALGLTAPWLARGLGRNEQGGGVVAHPPSSMRLAVNEDLPPALAETGLLVVVEGIVAECAWAQPGKRRITGLLVGGDLCCGTLSAGSDREWFTALTPCRVAILAWDEVDRLLFTTPSIGPALWHVTRMRAAIQREWLRNDSRPTEERLAHRICEVMLRTGITLGRVPLPRLRQMAWADMTAMTSVHANRCLRRMAAAGLLRMMHGAITVADPDKLRAFAGFDGSYLRPPGALPDWLHRSGLDIPVS